MGIRLERHAGGRGVKRRRTRDVEKIQRLAVEHQFEVIVNADVLDEVHCAMAPRGDGIMNRDDVYVRTRPPSGKMSLRGNFAEPGDGAPQRHRRKHLLARSIFRAKTPPISHSYGLRRVVLLPANHR